MTEQPDDILAGSWIIDPNDETIVLTDDMFTRPDDTPEREALIQADLDAMETADRVYATRLAELRRVIGWTQTQVGQRMRSSQPAVAAIESHTDMRISTLARYLTAIGGTAELTVHFADHQSVTIPMHELVAAS